MTLKSGDRVRHPRFGLGTVVDTLGSQAVVEFYGEHVAVELESLHLDEERPAAVEQVTGSLGRVLFRRAYEAINLGVVPPHPEQLLALSIGGDEFAGEVQTWFDEAPQKGLCKVVFGDYGTGKSHHLRMIEAAALNHGWVVSFVEFDPKQVDPAKPHLVYRAITGSMRFPSRADGSRCGGFFDLVGEVRANWDRVSLGKHLRESPWFANGMEVLRHHPHGDDQAYRDGVGWLSGHVGQQSVITALARSASRSIPKISLMPKTLEAADIYVHHLVVINEWCRALGYKGLLIMLDEAEHVRGYNVNRRGRANNLFDVLSRCAHPPLKNVINPSPNEHGIQLPTFWNQGPHFGLVVALTEGATFAQKNAPLHDACVFLHRESDIVRLAPPTPTDYERWCIGFLAEFERSYPDASILLRHSFAKESIAKVLAEEYERQPAGERTVRLWVKLTSLVPSLLLAQQATSATGLEEVLRRTAREAAGEILPWQM